MSKHDLTNAINACNERGDKAFVPYIMAGDGGIETLKKTILFLQEIGVTAIELGIPFSDPVADGAVIQEAGERALKHGVTLRAIMQEVASFKDEVTVPLVFMTYLNPIIHTASTSLRKIEHRVALVGSSFQIYLMRKAHC